MDPKFDLDLTPYLRLYTDFKPGINFLCINPLLAAPGPFKRVIAAIADKWRGHVDVVVGLEARGFYFGTPLLLELGIPFVPLRKKGKQPGKVVSVTYGLEYNDKETIELQVEGPIKAGSRVLIVDDVLATGGTAAAAHEAVAKVGGVVVGYAFVVEIACLNGRSKLPAGIPIQSLKIDGEPAAKAA